VEARSHNKQHHGRRYPAESIASPHRHHRRPWPTPTFVNLLNLLSHSFSPYSAIMSLEATMIMLVVDVCPSLNRRANSLTQCRQQRKQSQWRLHVRPSPFRHLRHHLTSAIYRSTRWQAQVDAVSIIHSVKMRVHPQSAVGLMSMGGKGPEVLSTFTTDFGSILAGLHNTKIHGTSHLSSSIQVAGVSEYDFPKREARSCRSLTER
jgi:hypothetical protein